MTHHTIQVIHISLIQLRVLHCATVITANLKFS